MAFRICSRIACTNPAVATLTYAYADSTAVLGPLSRLAEPHTYDLCEQHTQSLTVPRGWNILTIPGTEDDFEPRDDVWALAHAVREPDRTEKPIKPGGNPNDEPQEGSRPHLSVVRDVGWPSE